MEPILFLDIDGVINPFNRYKDIPMNPTLAKRLAIEKNDPSIEDLNPYLVHMVQYRFDWNSIQFIENLINEFNARIVISSSWRLMYTDEDFKGMFSIMNWKNAYYGKLDKYRSRYTLIQDYVKENNISVYLVLDDLDMTSYFKKRMILCHGHFSKENYEDARKSLIKQLNR